MDDSGINYILFGAGMLLLLVAAYFHMAPQAEPNPSPAAPIGSSVNIATEATFEGYEPVLYVQSPGISANSMPAGLEPTVKELFANNKITGKTAEAGKLTLQIAPTAGIPAVYAKLLALNLSNATFKSNGNFSFSAPGMRNLSVVVPVEPLFALGDRFSIEVNGYYDNRTLNHYTLDFQPYKKNFTASMRIDYFGRSILVDGVMPWDMRLAPNWQVMMQAEAIGLANVTFLPKIDSRITIIGRFAPDEVEKLRNLSWVASFANYTDRVEMEASTEPNVNTTQYTIVWSARAIIGPNGRFQINPQSYQLYADAPLNMTADKIGGAIGAETATVRREMHGHIPGVLVDENDRAYRVNNQLFTARVSQPIGQLDILMNQSYPVRVEATVEGMTVKEIRVSSK
ncbi:hypothetical protein COT30_01065 [Candidatus Micrarchaeota archaeon CG08_land_8_20_14_0_20_49_17]|nr:MAG: hypothetical protein AUJ13_03610 [Candidatus Micrarchaeota archaeon CG1_02_49_24]PIU10085.1 MAG: hypothetical protein COT30_01065 [Candidatus Micrarchaeota archaeon CG08_land_8_20_14_0_20_49_17]PIZ92363.1 MAG: hypothetical protein COX84_06845 [Candidatus Micrarchaeota archaeon CG_4_10_14_0_2_um_filter_49_7]HII53663.1 hypothetical protein [Candidatus Micrarchaeota archaeon]